MRRAFLPSARRPAAVTMVAAALALAASLGGCTGPARLPMDDATYAAGTDTALAALERLPVKGRAPKTGYSRARFGPAWADTDRTGCDQRNQVLARDLTEVRFAPGTHRCTVLTGQLRDPYGGSTINFVRGPKTSATVQVDHVVALSDAWQTGAQQLTDADRMRLATDPLELLAVSGRINDQKGDGDAATWLPPDRGYWCTYVARQVAVKQRYRLWVTAAERAAIARVLTACPSQPLPTS